jgi:hypothetical protein
MYSLPLYGSGRRKNTGNWVLCKCRQVLLSALSIDSTHNTRAVPTREMLIVSRLASVPEPSSPLYLGQETLALSGLPKPCGSRRSCVLSGL